MARLELFDAEQWDAGGRAFLLEIAGIGDGDDPVRYYSGPAPGAKTDTGSGKAYIDVQAITGVSMLSASIRPGGGVASYTPITITLARARDYPGRFDPGVILRRAGYRFGAYARLDETLPSDDAAGQVVYLDRDPAQLGTFPGHITIGGESCWATAGAGNGTAGNRWRLTGVTRGIRGTVPQSHYIGTTEVHRPFVKRECTTWKSRRAILYAAHIRLDGSVGTYAVVMRGFLRGAASLAESQVALELVPMVAIVDRKISADGRRVGLHNRKHCIEGSAAHSIVHSQIWRQGAAFRTFATPGTLAATEPVTVNTTDSHEDVFDVTLGASNPGHPRSGPVWFGGSAGIRGWRPWALGPVGYAGGFEFADNNQCQGAENGEAVENFDTAEAQVATFITPTLPGETAVLTWPDDYLSAISGTVGSGWRKSQRDGLAGAWADVVVILNDAEAGPHLRVVFNETSGGDPLFAAGSMELNFATGPFGFQGLDWSSGVGVRPPTDLEGLYYPFWFGAESPPADDTLFPRVESIRPPGSAGREGKIPIAVCTGGWYQKGERYITVDAEVLTTSAGDVPIRIEYTDPVDGERKVQRCRIIAVAEPEAGVWRLEVAPADRQLLRSFGNWPGLDPVVISPDVRFEPEAPGKVMLRLLTSIGGNAIGGNGFDSKPFGAGLLAEDVDLLSFLNVEAPAGLETWSPVVPPEGITLADLLEPILRALGVAMVMRLDTVGRCRIALVPVGPPTLVEEGVVALTDSVWLIDAPPDGEISEDDVVNVRKYLTDHDKAGEGDAQLITNIYDGGSISAHGSGGTEDVELRGINLRDGGAADTLAVLLGVDARLALLTGYALVRWTAETTTPAGWLLHPGAVVSVTSAYLSGFSDTVGVTDQLARVASIKTQLWTDGCALTLEHTGNRSTGWNLALRVVDGPAVDELEVDVAGTWAPAENPITGEALDPLTYLVVGHLVDVVPWGDHDSRVQLTVDAIDTGTRVVTLSGAHGLVAPNWGRIVWTDYDDAPAVAQGFAYLADDNDTLGAGGDDGFELV
jgi:hypothetical protein